MNRRTEASYPLPRPCKIDGHQYVATGYCWAITPSGVALVEMEDGRVVRYDLTEHTYWLTFTDAGR